MSNIVNGKGKLITTFGQFTVRTWINLLLTKKIKLPEYQRKFVWEPYRVIELYKSLKEGTFIPPVLIAHITNGEKGDYILDGQQRLTALLLLYLGVYPNYGNSKDKLKEILDNEDISFEIEWTMDKLLKCNSDSNDDIKIQNLVAAVIEDKNRDEVKTALTKTNLYVDLKDKSLYDVWFEKNSGIINGIDIETIWESCTLSYCFIKVSKPETQEENKMYARIFKDINTNSVKLSYRESRRALYWSRKDDEFVAFFEPVGMKNIQVGNDKIDLASLLAYVAERATGVSRFAVNRRSDERRQAYFNEYVESVLYDEESPVFGKFDLIVKDKKGTMEKVVNFYSSNIKSNIKNDRFNNIKEVQIYLFGVLYWIIYKGKSIEWNDGIKSKIEKYIKEDTDSDRYNNITKIRDRMEKSIEYYKPKEGLF